MTTTHITVTIAIDSDGDLLPVVREMELKYPLDSLKNKATTETLEKLVAGGVSGALAEFTAQKPPAQDKKVEGTIPPMAAYPDKVPTHFTKKVKDWDGNVLYLNGERNSKVIYANMAHLMAGWQNIYTASIPQLNAKTILLFRDDSGAMLAADYYERVIGFFPENMSRADAITSINKFIESQL